MSAPKSSSTSASDAIIDQNIKSTLKQNGYFNAIKICNTLQGSVWSSIKPDTKEPVIIKATNKRLHKQKVAKVNGKQYHAQENILKERAILKYLTTHKNSPNEIVKYLGWFTDAQYYYLVMENGGNSLFDFITKVHEYLKVGKIEISEWHKFVRLLFKQMVTAVDYMHKHNVAHFDISLENMLINDVDVFVDKDDNLKFIINDEDNPIQLKMCDLGLAEYFGHDTNTKCSFRSSKVAGKSNYKSPEIIAKKGAFNAASNDVWCLGICLFMMIMGGSPFNSASVSDVNFKLIRKGKMMKIMEAWDRKHYVTAELVDLLTTILQFEGKRASITDLKQHPWFRE